MRVAPSPRLRPAATAVESAFVLSIFLLFLFGVFEYGRLLLGLNLTASRVNNKYLPFENTGGFEGGVFQNMAVFNPTYPVIDPKTGTFYEIGAGSQSVRNPVALARQIDDRAPENRVLGNVTASYPLLPSLTAKTTFGTSPADRSACFASTCPRRGRARGCRTSGSTGDSRSMT